MQKRINKAIAAVNPTPPYSQVDARISQAISVARQRAVAYTLALAKLANDWDVDDVEEPEAQPALAAVVAGSGVL